MTTAWILDAARTPRGRGKKDKGALSGIHPQELLSQTLNALAERTGIEKEDVEDVVMGCVSQAGEQGANIARNAMIALAILGTLISVAMSVGKLWDIGAWVAVLTTISAAIATFVSLNRFDFLASAYAKQAYALSQLRRERKAGGLKDWSEFVAKCEETISAENRAWMAEMLRQRETLQGVLPDDKNGSPS